MLIYLNAEDRDGRAQVAMRNDVAATRNAKALDLNLGFDGMSG
jgi:hypothetical protein